MLERTAVLLLLLPLAPGWRQPYAGMGGVAGAPSAAGAPEEIRTPAGRLLGEIRARSDGRLEARDPAGRLVGIYDRHRKETLDRNGRLLFRGNALAALIVCGSAIGTHAGLNPPTDPQVR